MFFLYSLALFALAATASAQTTTTTSACPSNTPPSSAGKVSFAGVNIAGFDFGCTTDGACTEAGAYPPLVEYYGPDGLGQINHFASADKLNVFRLPVGWQYLTNNAESGTLNSTTLGIYNKLVQGCLASGAHCIIDIHNYARFNGDIIGQGGPSNTIFADLWSSIATEYASTDNIIFGVMNEPHDLPSITTWAATVQAAVTAIRNAGATSQYILLPGDNWTSAETFVSNGSAAALSVVTNPDGSTTNLIFDVHKYLDSDNSGTSATCVTNNIDDAFEPLAQWLRCNKRQAFLTETGGGNNDDCVTYMCAQLDYLNSNSDVYLGWVGWAAGSFATQTGYVLQESPNNSSTGVLTDVQLVSSCIAGAF